VVIDALDGRRLVSILAIDTVVLLCLIGLAAYQGIGPNYYFGEYRFGTYFSSLQFLLIAGTTYSVYATLRRQPQHPLSGTATLWMLASGGAVFLACDDLFSFHEKTDKLIHTVLRMEETPVTDLIDDLLVGLYVLATLIFLGKNRARLTAFLPSWPLFAAGFVLTGIMVVLDMSGNNELVVGQLTDEADTRERLREGIGTVEDCFKIFAEGCFLAGVLACRRIVGGIGPHPRPFSGGEGG
jgi:hypothetical protein